MTKVSGAAVVAVLLALGLGACGTDQASRSSAGTARSSGAPSTTSEPTLTPTPAPTVTPTIAPGSKTRVVVHDAGAQPRQRLLFAVSAGATQHLDMTMDMGMTMTVNGEKAPTPALPAMRIGVGVAVSDVSDDGDITASFRYGKVDVLGHDAAADQIRAKLAPITSMRGTLRTTASGLLLEGDLDVPAGFDPTIRSTLDSFKEQLGNMVVPLPTVPVGVGATWTVHTESALNGLQAQVDYDYELLERHGDRLTLGLHYVESIGAQQVQLPTMPAGVQTRVHASRINGSGRTVVDLGALLPVDASMQARGPVRMTVDQGGQHADIVEQLTLNVAFSQ